MTQGRKRCAGLAFLKHSRPRFLGVLVHVFISRAFVPVDDHETEYEYEGSDGEEAEVVEGEPRFVRSLVLFGLRVSQKHSDNSVCVNGALCASLWLNQFRCQDRF